KFALRILFKISLKIRGIPAVLDRLPERQVELLGIQTGLHRCDADDCGVKEKVALDRGFRPGLLSAVRVGPDARNDLLEHLLERYSRLVHGPHQLTGEN